MSYGFIPDGVTVGQRVGDTFNHPRDGSGFAAATDINDPSAQWKLFESAHDPVNGPPDILPNTSAGFGAATGGDVTTAQLNAAIAGEAALRQMAIDNINADRQIGTFAASAFGGPGDYPAADKGDYLYCLDPGVITLNGTQVTMRIGDRLRCTVDDTPVDTEANWTVQRRDDGMILGDAAGKRRGTVDFIAKMPDPALYLAGTILTMENCEVVYDQDLPTSVYHRGFESDNATPTWIWGD